MKEIKMPEPGTFGSQYFAQECGDGVVRCSCGRQLVKLDEVTWKCPGGYPVYRLDTDDFVKDKFGNLLIRQKEHPPEVNGKDSAAKKAALSQTAVDVGDTSDDEEDEAEDECDNCGDDCDCEF